MQTGLVPVDRSDMDRYPFDETLTAAQAGAPWACTQLYTDLNRPVAAFVRLRGVPDPDDVASEVFLQVFRGLGSFEGDEAAFRAWVFTIARRRVQDVWRARRHRPRPAPLDTAVDRAGGDAEAEAIQQLGDPRLAAMLEALTPEQREVVLLHVVADLPLRQVAAVTSRSVGAVKALQHRAVRALRRAASEGPVTATPAPAI